MVHFCVTERSFCDTTTSTDAGRASAPELHTDTIPGYLHGIGEFAEYFGKSPELMGADEVREFQLHMIQEKKLALGTVALRMGGTTFLVQEDRLTVGVFETSSARTRQNFLFQLALHTNGALAGRRGHEIAEADCETSQISGGIISQRGFGAFLQIACKLLAPKEAQ